MTGLFHASGVFSELGNFESNYNGCMSCRQGASHSEGSNLLRFPKTLVSYHVASLLQPSSVRFLLIPMWMCEKNLSVYLRKVSGLSPNTLCNASGFSLPPIKTDRHHILNWKIVEYGEKWQTNKINGRVRKCTYEYIENFVLPRLRSTFFSWWRGSFSFDHTS
jgi:hypothetical protein